MSKGWKNEKHRHSMAARGVRTLSDIEKGMADLEAQRKQLAKQQEELEKQRAVFANIERIDKLFYSELDEIPYKKMENTPPTEDEIHSIFENMTIDEYIEAEYSGDYDYFLDDWPIFFEELQNGYQLYDAEDRNRLEQFREENDMGFDTPDAVSNDDYLENMDSDEFKDFYKNYLHGRWNLTGRDIISDFGGAMEIVHEHGELCSEAAISYMEDEGTRNPLDARFRVTEEDKIRTWENTLKHFNTTQEEYDYHKALMGKGVKEDFKKLMKKVDKSAVKTGKALNKAVIYVDDKIDADAKDTAKDLSKIMRKV